jgi:hypothetical protein
VPTGAATCADRVAKIWGANLAFLGIEEDRDAWIIHKARTCQKRE